MNYRTEKDSLGEKEIPSDALYGIHSVRAAENFPGHTPFPAEWYKSTALTKLACYITYKKFSKAALGKYGEKVPLQLIDEKVIDALIEAAEKLSAGDYFDQFIVPAIQGGAGTSINMNINEIITNVALVKTGNKPGDYHKIDPITDSNVFQSTNDVIPTALTIAVSKLLGDLEEKINSLRARMESLERDHRDKLRPGFTQMQEAVPSSFGILFGGYNEALSRDWWRVSKCFERIRHVNLGGGATGTGPAIPRYFIMEVVPELRALTGMNLSHSENLHDTTANLDKWVEVHAILKAHAVNLEKISADLRLLSADVAGTPMVRIPPRQTGSSIMPGKINPVIAEFVISSAHKVYSNDVLISSLSGQGALELNAYLPAIGCAMIESIRLLIAADQSIADNMIAGLEINSEAGYDRLMRSPVITTSLVPWTGYHKAGEMAKTMKEKNLDIFEANRLMGIIDEDKLKQILRPGNLLSLGFSLEDIRKDQ